MQKEHKQFFKKEKKMKKERKWRKFCNDEAEKKERSKRGCAH